MGMPAFYILQSEKTPKRYYTGFTENLESHLKSHNLGDNPHTSIFKLWRIKTAVAFTNRQGALDFEAYHMAAIFLIIQPNQQIEPVQNENQRHRLSSVHPFNKITLFIFLKIIDIHLQTFGV